MGIFKPSMLCDPKYEGEWIEACKNACGGDILERMEILKTDILVDYNSKYQDEKVMLVKGSPELKKLHNQ